MKPKFNMDAKAYNTLLEGVNHQYFVEKRGDQSDFRLYFDDLWLADTAVIDDVHRSRGAWSVNLIFASIHNPLKFIRRHITLHACPKRAAQQGEFMRRVAAKDQRGTLSVHVRTLQLCKN